MNAIFSPLTPSGRTFSYPAFSVLAIWLCASPLQALQAIDDADMASVYGQSGISIDTQIEADDGTLLTIGSVTYTEENKDDSGDEFLQLKDIGLQIVEIDDAGNVLGPGFISTRIDVAENGNLNIRSSELGAINFTVGSIEFSGRSIGALGLNRWRFAPGSFLETTVLNDTPVKIRSRTLMTDGSGIDFRYIEDDLLLTSNIEFKSDSLNRPFQSEFFLSADNQALKIEFGETRGTLEFNNLKLSDNLGNPLLNNQSFGDLGYGDIVVNQGYFTVRANDNGEGLSGELLSDITVGTAFYRTDENRLNFENVNIATNGEIRYQLELVGSQTDFARGMTAILTDISDLDLTIGSIIFSQADGLSGRSDSLGAFAIENLNLNGGALVTSLWALSATGSQGIRLDAAITRGAQFDFTYADDESSAAKLTAEVVLGEFSAETLLDITPKGLNFTVENLEAEAHVNAIRIGDGSLYQGQTGRIDIDGLVVQPGSYLRVEPIPSI